jgi:hypothetical protein
MRRKIFLLKLICNQNFHRWWPLVVSNARGQLIVLECERRMFGDHLQGDNLPQTANVLSHILKHGRLTIQRNVVRVGCAMKEVNYRSHHAKSNAVQGFTTRAAQRLASEEDELQHARWWERALNVMIGNAKLTTHISK